MGHNSLTEVMLFDFHKNSPLGANWQFGANLAQNYLILYFMICSKDFCNMVEMLQGCCYMVGHNR